MVNRGDSFRLFGIRGIVAGRSLLLSLGAVYTGGCDRDADGDA